jgi:streptothricin acetyltransferase
MVNASIRALTTADLPRLAQIDANYIADTLLVVDREQQGLDVTFRISERPRPFAYVKRDGYNVGPAYQQDLGERLARGQGLYLAAEAAGQLVGFLDLELETWRPTASLQWVAIDRSWRGQGLGRTLIERAITWTKQRGLRALVLETQNTNIDACRFYQRLGFRLSGVQDLFYFDERVAEECALFWVYLV